MYNLQQKGALMYNIEDLFYYDETSKTFLRWRIEIRAGKNLNVVKVPMNSEAGSISSSGYYQVSRKGMSRKVHRVIWELFNGPIPKGLVIDHIDGNSLNNNIRNLALKTTAQNTRNSRMNRRNKSGAVGVSYLYTGYWRAQWHLGDKIESRYFSVKTHGDDRAKELAIIARNEGICKLNGLGYNYTERHGTND